MKTETLEASKDKMQEFPILESLSKATAQELQPLQLSPTCALFVGTTEDAEHFTITLAGVNEVPFGPYTAKVARRITDLKARELKNSKGRFFVEDTYHWPRHEAAQWMRSVVEKRLLTGNKYKVAATDYVALQIRHCWPSDRIFFLDETAELLYTFLLRRFFAQSSRAEMSAQFKLNEVIPEMPEDFIEHPVFPLADCQKVALAYSLSQEASALTMDKGTGKTAVSIARICLEAQRFQKKSVNKGKKKLYRALIVVPNQVRVNWQNEFSKFAVTPGKVTVVRGTKLKRIKLLTHAIRYEEDCNFTAVVVSYDSVSADVEVLEHIPWDIVICDESHYFKSASTKRFKSLKRIRDNSKHRMILTGTIIGNSIMDLWSQFEFLGKGLSGFSTFESFRKFHGKFETAYIGGGTTVQKLTGYANVPLVQERLSRLAFSVSKKEAKLNLPDKVYDTWEIELTPEQENLYVKLKEELIIKIQSQLATEGAMKISADHILTQLLRLQQICSGFIKFDDVKDPETKIILKKGATRQINTKNPKVEAVLSMLLDPEKDPNEKTIIWCCFREDLRKLEEALTEAGIVYGRFWGMEKERLSEENVLRFNNDSTFKVLLANPASAGEGLNLLGYNPESEEKQDTYCGHEIFYSCNWSYLQRSQAEDRAHRRGTKRTVRITDLVVETAGNETAIDTEIRARVNAKEQSATSIQDVKAILQSVLNIDLGGLL